MTRYSRKKPQQILSEAGPSQDPAADTDMLIEMLQISQRRAAALSILMSEMANKAKNNSRSAPRLVSCAEEMAEMVAILDECVQVTKEVRAKALGHH